MEITDRSVPFNLLWHEAFCIGPDSGCTHNQRTVRMRYDSLITAETRKE